MVGSYDGSAAQADAEVGRGHHTEGNMKNTNISMDSFRDELSKIAGAMDRAWFHEKKQHAATAASKARRGLRLFSRTPAGRGAAVGGILGGVQGAWEGFKHAPGEYDPYTRQYDPPPFLGRVAGGVKGAISHGVQGAIIGGIGTHLVHKLVK